MNRTRLCPTSRRARWLVAAVVWASVGGRWGPSPARADEPPASGPPSSTDEPLLLQWFAVGALTRGATWFSPPYGPYTSTTSAITGIHEELFGEEGEETIKPFGTVPDLIDLVKRATPAGTWDREGVSIAEQSRSHIVVRATASTLELVEAFLLDLEREAMRTVTFDCVVVRGVPSDVVDANDLQRAIATGVLEPLLGARVVGHVHQSAVARTGGERTYLIDTDVEMDESLAGMDPIVGVLFDGISVRA